MPATIGMFLALLPLSQRRTNRRSVGAQRVGNSIPPLRTKAVRTISNDRTSPVTEVKVNITQCFLERTNRSLLASGNSWQSTERSGRDGASYGPPQEQHVPVGRFNAQEIRDVLKRGQLVAFYFRVFSDILEQRTIAWRLKTRKLRGTKLLLVRPTAQSQAARGAPRVSTVGLSDAHYAADFHQRTPWATVKTSFWSSASKCLRCSRARNVRVAEPGTHSYRQKCGIDGV